MVPKPDGYPLCCLEPPLSEPGAGAGGAIIKLPLGPGALITNYGSGSGSTSCPGSLILYQIFEEI
jgi:hypothetical protein